MSDYAKRLLEQRANTWEQAKALLQAAADEKRELTAEEEVQYGRMSADLDSLRAKADKFIEDERVAAESEAALRSLAEARKSAPAEEPSEDAAFRRFLNGEARSYDAAPVKGELRDLTKGTATAGGHTVPTSFHGQLIEHLIEVAQLVNYATVLQTDSGENIDIPITTAYSSAAITPEATPISESDPAFNKRTLGAYKYGVLVQVSSELLADSAFDIQSFVARQAGRALGNAIGAHLVTGDASSKPSGLMTSTTLGVTSGTGVAGVPTADNLIDLYYSVISPYRNSRSAAWLMRDATVASVRKLKDTTNNYLWVPGLAGAPDTILGKPVLTDPNVAATGTTAKSIAFGDLSAYYVRLAGGVRFERSDDYAFNSDITTFRAILRGDGILVDQTGAVKHFVGAAS